MHKYQGTFHSPQKCNNCLECAKSHVISGNDIVDEQLKDKNTCSLKKDGCPGESWRCFFKKWHMIIVSALLVGIGTNASDYIFNQLLPQKNKQNNEPVPVKTTTSMEVLHENQKIIVVDPLPVNQTQTPVQTPIQIPVESKIALDPRPQYVHE